MSATEWNALAAHRPTARKQPAPLLYFLGFVFMLFIGILVVCYVITRRTNPVFLDQHGKPATASSEHLH